MKTVIIISFSNLYKDPRVNRQIGFLSEKYRVVAVGLEDPQMANVQFIPVAKKGKSLFRRIVSVLQLLFRQYESYYWRLNHVDSSLKKLAHTPSNLILANDIDTLPLALKLSPRAKVIFDAHEYAPREFEDVLRFKIFFQRYKTYLCQTYIPQVDAMTTVGQTIADQYEKDSGIKPTVLTNAPDYENLEPNLKDEYTQRIRLIHHGAAIPSRKIENMIEMMNYLDDRFELDMVLVPGFKTYIAKLKERARTNSKIRFLPPVPRQQLVKFSNQYDIGLFLLEPTNFNYLHTLPNKLFEFIQARLVVAIGPSPEMARIVEAHDCGVVASDFSPKTLAHRLMQLDHAKINYYKRQSHKIARIMSAEQNKKILLDLVEQVLER